MTVGDEQYGDLHPTTVGEVTAHVAPTWAAKGVVHGFGDRSLNALADPASLTAGLAGWAGVPAPLVKLHFLRQVHGTNVVFVDSVEQLHDVSVPEADGWIISRELAAGSPHLFAVKTADCFPVILVSPRYVAVLHIGWRGAVANFLGLAMEALLTRERSSSAGGDVAVEAAIGPGIQRHDFEIKEDVAIQLSRAFDSVGAKGDGCGLPWSLDGSRMCGDIPALLIRQATACGVKPEQLHVSKLSTFADERFFSYRRSPADSGRQISFVMVD